MNFRDQMKIDVQRVFSNPNEFSEVHVWASDSQNPVPYYVNMIIESFTLDGKPLQYVEGVASDNVVIHVDPDALGYIPAYGQLPLLDNRVYRVTGVSNEFGIIKIVLTGNFS
ncbi:hypothetical protein KQ941_02855 [Paenibacillus xylanexedens]|uniref:hypothetical protein n=1 Tax=Paenibacillus xylanexedens TaxID=528191 RepID=UPI001F49200C|nr:hypothetical protein [Paenibacillus xylanexedens]MCF7753368.1 hypothetical protein [Paenibacillus xylanexedens]